MIAESSLSQPRFVDRNFIAEIAEGMKKLPAIDSPTVHRFTPGLYTRQIFMAAGSQYLSKIHKTEHQYIVSQGACLVSENGEPAVMIVAPYHGKTMPGTWRQLLIIMDCVWTTMHPTDKTTVEEVERDIISPTEEQNE